MPGTFQRSRASAADSASKSGESPSIKRLLPYCETAVPARSRSLARQAETAETRIEEEISASHQGSEAGDHRAARAQHGRYWIAAGSDRAVDATHQRADGAPPRAPEGPLLAPRPAQARRPTPAAPAVPAKAGPRGVPRTDSGAGTPEVRKHSTEGGSLSEPRRERSWLKAPPSPTKWRTDEHCHARPDRCFGGD